MGLALMAKERRDMRHGPQEAKIHAMAFDCRACHVMQRAMGQGAMGGRAQGSVPAA